jgi:putative nucleotidyltransferase with HDIG domain
MSTKIDIGEIQRAAQNSIPLTFKLTTLPLESHALLDRILEVYLSELGQENILEPLSYCLKELIVNAQKANGKRVYFAEKGLDITSEDEYEKGMKDLLRTYVENIGHFILRLKERDLVIEVTFRTTGNKLIISVRNNSELTSKEQSRIFDRITRARAFNSFFEALTAPLDDTEGAGLGLMILFQFLKRIGLGEEAFSMEVKDGQTEAAISIPMSADHLQKLKILMEALVRDIDSLPHFPENVTELIQLTLDPNVEIIAVAEQIATDPALTADLLKHVNSAYYMLPSRVNNIPQAVKLVGLKGLRSILYSYGTQKVLGEKYKEMKNLWEHSYRTAFYAFHIARYLKRSRDILDDVYVAGILHDLGLIIVMSVHPELHEKMIKFCREKNISPGILERFSFGMNHAVIGALMARKWNFPDVLVEGIQFHHDPLLASLPCRDIVFCVYLANAICDLERGLISYSQIEKPVLSEFGIKNEAQFARIAESVKKSFDVRRQKLRGTA